MITSSENRRIREPSTYFTALFLVSIFLFLWLRINPSFYGLVQYTGFQGTRLFLTEYLSYPGGIVDYCSAFLSAYFIYPVVGAIVITLLLWVIAYATHRVLRLLFGPRTWYTAHLYPVALCGALQCTYDHPLSVTLALCIALLLFVGYGYQRSRRAFIRALLFLSLGCSLYYCAGGAFLLFSLLCLLFEMTVCRRLALGLFYGAAASVIPFLAKSCVFLISSHDAYLHLLPFGGLGYTVPILPYALYAYFPALFFITPGISLFRKSTSVFGAIARFFKGIKPLAKAFISGIILSAVTVALFILSFHRNDNTVLRFCSMFLHSEWSDILKTARERSTTSTLFTNFTVAQALYHTNSLLVDLFSFPHYSGVRGLFLSDDETAPYGKLEAFSFFYRGELAFELGLVNSAQHWYYEALSTQGATAAVVKRLCQIHALKGDFEAARICLSMLETMPMQRKWARQFRNRLKDRSLLTPDTQLARVQQSMPTTDFLLADSRQPYHDCEEALRQNPKNRMAFEYSMAAYLLSGNLQKIAWLAGYLDTLGYSTIPLLCEQALVMLKAGDVPLSAAVADRISQKTLDDFLSIDGILYRFQGDLSAAKSIIADTFRDSYWYYYFYRRPNPARGQ
jgi:hypothetical protein